MKKFRIWIGTLILGFAMRILGDGDLKRLLWSFIYDNMDEIKQAWNQDMRKK